MSTITTEELFRDDATLLQCQATVLAADGYGIVLDRSVFYPQGGGQAGDSGTLETEAGAVLTIADTRKHPSLPGVIVHVHVQVPAPEADAMVFAAFAPGTVVTARVDGPRRRAHMRFHTATHLLCALVPYPVDGCSITATYARLDFHTAEPLDKEALCAGLLRLVAGAHPVRQRSIGEAELDANPQLVRSMRVQPPRSADGQGRIRLIEIEGVDQQPCGGTHVANSAEVGAVTVTKIEKKSAQTRRVVLGFAEPAAGRG